MIKVDNKKKNHTTPLGSSKMPKESFRVYEFLLWVHLPKRHKCLNNPWGLRYGTSSQD